MNIDIRKSIKANFKGNNETEIKNSIDSAISDNDEITLPGLGVFFEILWQNSNDVLKENIISNIKKGL